ncbi:MAG: acyl-CoA dehydrogenase C-terminal domain-containing protein [Myxococcales bacterium]|nr:acyl-CoA dehydrogenase C-terminal domain-containing protein [Myxococcales bacterium]
MSHLKFDKRDWQFILRDQHPLKDILALKQFADYDMETCEAVLTEGVKFAVDRIAPTHTIGDREGCEAIGGRVRTPAVFSQLWKEYSEAGWIGVSMATDFGGQGLPTLLASAVFEAHTAANQSFHMFAGLTSGAAHLIESFGSDALKNLYVERMYTGKWGGTMCLTEPQAGSAVPDLTTTAVPVDEAAGVYGITGTKIFISGGDADFYENVIHLVLARRKGDPEGTRGISLFVVPRVLVDAQGKLGAHNHVLVERIEEKLGIHGSPTCQISFGADGQTIGYLVGEPGKGLPYMFQMMNEARVACGLQGVAQANAAFQQALSYARDRRQGPDLNALEGKSVEIINHPDVRRNLMLMKAFSEGTRALVAQAAFWNDMALHGDDPELRAKYQDLADLATPVVKAYSTDKAFRVTELAVQVFGGYGYTKDYPVEQYLRDCKIASIYEGTNGIQAMDLLGRKMRLKSGALFMTYIQELGSFIEANASTPGLEKAFELLQKAQGIVGETAFWFSGTARQNIKAAMLQATPFLELFGDLMVGHQLLQQAAIAARQLTARVGTTEVTREQRLADTEVAFLAAKLDTARFFAFEVLLLASGKARSIQSNNTAPLDIEFI